MKKDILVAICVGFVLGAIAALTVTNLPKIIKEGIKTSSNKISATPAPLEIKTNIQSIDFSVDSPKDGSVSDNKSIDITGKAKAGQIVLIETENDQKAIDPDSSGNFTTKLNLNEGVNNIYLTIYDEGGNSNSKIISVYYTTEKL